MKKIILFLLPEKWLNEIYYRGYSDAGARVKDAGYWFSSSPPLSDALLEIGQNLFETKGTGIERVRENIYNKYPWVRNGQPGESEDHFVNRHMQRIKNIQSQLPKREEGDD